MMNARDIIPETRKYCLQNNYKLDALESVMFNGMLIVANHKKPIDEAVLHKALDLYIAGRQKGQLVDEF